MERWKGIILWLSVNASTIWDKRVFDSRKNNSDQSVSVQVSGVGGLSQLRPGPATISVDTITGCLHLQRITSFSRNQSIRKQIWVKLKLLQVSSSQGKGKSVKGWGKWDLKIEPKI